MERNRRKLKNDKWMMYGFYEVRKTFKRSNQVQLEERKDIRDCRESRKVWLRVYIYRKKKPKEILWIMPKDIQTVRGELE